MKADEALTANWKLGYCESFQYLIKCLALEKFYKLWLLALVILRNSIELRNSFIMLGDSLNKLDLEKSLIL